MDSVHSNIRKYINDTIRTIPDFPKPGIQFKDVTTLLSDREALELTSYMLAISFRDIEVDYVIGLESRGFLFGTNLAQDLNAGFVPVRKPNKLPAETVKATYELEYGVDSLEMHKDAFTAGSRVLIHDDLIATGGTAEAASRLVQELGGIVVGYSFIIELGFLEGKKKLSLSSDTIFDSIIRI